MSRHRSASSSRGYLRDVGIFWDIENLPIPKKANVRAMVDRLRTRFVNSSAFRERVFAVVGNIRQMSEELTAGFGAVNVEIHHVEQDRKNAADLSISAKITRFIDDVDAVHAGSVSRPRPRVVLLTSDIHFKDDLYRLKMQKGTETILIYRSSNHELLDFADEKYDFGAFFANIVPVRQRPDDPEFVSEGPSPRFRYKFVIRLHDYGTLGKEVVARHVEPLGGKVITHVPNGYAKIGFRQKTEAESAMVKIPQRPLNGKPLRTTMVAEDNEWMLPDSTRRVEVRSHRGDPVLAFNFLERQFGHFPVDHFVRGGVRGTDPAAMLVKFSSQVSMSEVVQMITRLNTKHTNYYFEVEGGNSSLSAVSVPPANAMGTRQATFKQPLLALPTSRSSATSQPASRSVVINQAPVRPPVINQTALRPPVVNQAALRPTVVNQPALRPTMVNQPASRPIAIHQPLLPSPASTPVTLSQPVLPSPASRPALRGSAHDQTQPKPMTRDAGQRLAITVSPNSSRDVLTSLIFGPLETLDFTFSTTADGRQQLLSGFLSSDEVSLVYDALDSDEFKRHGCEVEFVDEDGRSSPSKPGKVRLVNHLCIRGLVELVKKSTLFTICVMNADSAVQTLAKQLTSLGITALGAGRSIDLSMIETLTVLCVTRDLYFRSFVLLDRMSPYFPCHVFVDLILDDELELGHQLASILCKLKLVVDKCAITFRAGYRASEAFVNRISTFFNVEMDPSSSCDERSTVVITKVDVDEAKVVADGYLQKFADLLVTCREDPESQVLGVLPLPSTCYRVARLLKMRSDDRIAIVSPTSDRLHTATFILTTPEAVDGVVADVTHVVFCPVAVQRIYVGATCVIKFFEIDERQRDFVLHEFSCKSARLKKFVQLGLPAAAFEPRPNTFEFVVECARLRLISRNAYKALAPAPLPSTVKLSEPGDRPLLLLKYRLPLNPCLAGFVATQVRHGRFTWTGVQAVCQVEAAQRMGSACDPGLSSNFVGAPCQVDLAHPNVEEFATGLKLNPAFLISAKEIFEEVMKVLEITVAASQTGSPYRFLSADWKDSGCTDICRVENAASWSLEYTKEGEFTVRLSGAGDGANLCFIDDSAPSYTTANTVLVDVDKSSRLTSVGFDVGSETSTLSGGEGVERPREEASSEVDDGGILVGIYGWGTKLPSLNADIRRQLERVASAHGVELVIVNADSELVEIRCSGIASTDVHRVEAVQKDVRSSIADCINASSQYGGFFDSPTAAGLAYVVKPNGLINGLVYDSAKYCVLIGCSRTMDIAEVEEYLVRIGDLAVVRDAAVDGRSACRQTYQALFWSKGAAKKLTEVGFPKEGVTVRAYTPSVRRKVPGSVFVKWNPADNERISAVAKSVSSDLDSGEGIVELSGGSIRLTKMAASNVVYVSSCRGKISTVEELEGALEAADSGVEGEVRDFSAVNTPLAIREVCQLLKEEVRTEIKGSSFVVRCDDLRSAHELAEDLLTCLPFLVCYPSLTAVVLDGNDAFLVSKQIVEPVRFALEIDPESSSLVDGYAKFLLAPGSAEHVELQAFTRKTWVKDFDSPMQAEWAARFGPWVSYTVDNFREADFVQVAWGKLFCCAGVEGFLTTISSSPQECELVEVTLPANVPFPLVVKGLAEKRGITFANYFVGEFVLSVDLENASIHVFGVPSLVNLYREAVKRELEELATTLAVSDGPGDGFCTCPFCGHAPESGISLKLCGHTFCAICLGIICLWGKGVYACPLCKVCMDADDLRKLVTDKSMQPVDVAKLENAFCIAAAKSSGVRYAHCPTFGCRRLIPIDRKMQNGDDGLVRCGECRNWICHLCGDFGHPGKTCIWFR